MATFYVKHRKNGPVAVFSVIASTRESAMAAVKSSAAAGEEFDIWDVNLFGYGIAAVTGPTGP